MQSSLFAIQVLNAVPCRAAGGAMTLIGALNTLHLFMYLIVYFEIFIRFVSLFPLQGCRWRHDADWRHQDPVVKISTVIICFNYLRHLSPGTSAGLLVAP